MPSIRRGHYEEIATLSRHLQTIARTPRGGLKIGVAVQPLTPCHTAPLFLPLSQALQALLRSLSADDWLRPTVAGAWRVRDVAAHLLDVQWRRLSAQRDAHRPPPDRVISSDRDLAAFINAINATGVAYGARLSTRVLTDLLDLAGTQVAEVMRALDPHAPALYGVSWAGEQASENWMDAGREYTEHWHHQMQIRDAVGRPRLLEPLWMTPLLDMSVRALPHAYAGVSAPTGTAITLRVTGETTGTWSLVRGANRWQILGGRPPVADAIVTVAADDVWRMFYNALSEEALGSRVTVEGKCRPGRAVAAGQVGRCLGLSRAGHRYFFFAIFSSASLATMSGPDDAGFTARCRCGGSCRLVRCRTSIAAPCRWRRGRRTWCQSPWSRR